MLKRLSALVFVVSAVACGGTGTPSSSPTAPTPSASPTPSNFSLAGKVVTSRTMVPIPDATASIFMGPDAGKSTRTDAAGNFTFTGLQQPSIAVEVTATDYFATRAPLGLNQPQTIFLVPLGPTIVLTGQVTDATTGAPIPGASVGMNTRYFATTDASGNYSLPGHLDIGESSIVYAVANGYETYTRYVRGTSAQSFRLRRLERITAGELWSVTLRPDDSLCYDDLQDPSFGAPGSGFLCRTVNVIAPTDGMMTLEAVSSSDGSHPPVAALVSRPCCFEKMQNPISITVTAGTEVTVNVEMPENSTMSRSFTLSTSMSP